MLKSASKCNLRHQSLAEGPLLQLGVAAMQGELTEPGFWARAQCLFELKLQIPLGNADGPADAVAGISLGQMLAHKCIGATYDVQTMTNALLNCLRQRVVSASDGFQVCPD